ncbi:MAG: translation termination factor GTPase eRF3 [Trizodia sp. TS-e1964]|nr:MAG: translation termination factor GTPase eRF3 [Trizodia sp. TS-e1964]
MAHLQSWEDDVAEDGLSRQVQDMKIQPSAILRPGASSFKPTASVFQPGAASFQPGAASFQTARQVYESQPQVTANENNFSNAPPPPTKVLSITENRPPILPEAESSTPEAENSASTAVDLAKEEDLEDLEKETIEENQPQAIRAVKTKVEEKAPTQSARDIRSETLAKRPPGKEHVNVIFIGHVDSGKSTLGGSILYATGMVDERTMEKYKREAKELGRETWYLSWALDLTKEERAKGKTVEVGRGFFETEKRRYTILDAPGHKTFVPSMIGGASQADVGVLVISARKGEYETGFEKGGQTREHAMLVKTQGVSKLVIVVNKMDDPTVQWSQERFNECIAKLSMFLKGIKYAKQDLFFMPISAQTTIGIKERVPKELAPWYDGPSLLEYLDNMDTLDRKISAPFMMPINGKYRDMGTIVEGKIESGSIAKGMTCTLMPNREKIEVAAIFTETEEEVPIAVCGDQVRIRLRGVEEEDIMPGFVLCDVERPVHCVNSFEAQINVLELKSILTAGFNCVLHVHSAIEEVTFALLLNKVDKKTKKIKKLPAFASKGDIVNARLEVIGGAGAVCVERFDDYPQLGRFTLRDQGQTIAIGRITKLITSAAQQA